MKAINFFKTKSIFKPVMAAAVAAVFAWGCEPDDSDAVPAGLPSTAEVFIDGFSGGLDYQAFGDSKVTAFQVDDEVTFNKSNASMRFDVPNAGDPESGYAGGIFFDATGRDLSGYNVLSFWGRASQGAVIQELGFGLYTTETFRTSITNVQFSTAWTQYFIILPDASKLTAEGGMFYFVDTPDNGNGYSFWIDDLKYENLGTVGQLQPLFQNGNEVDLQAFVGQILQPGGLGLTFSMPNGVEQPVNAAPAYFSLASNSGAVNILTNEETGVQEISVVGVGEATVTASLGGVDAQGSLNLSVSDFVAAPAPTRDAADVISIFSDVYDNEPVDFYNGFYAPFQTTESADFEVNGDNVLNYINYNFVGIEFNQNVPTIDGSNMTGLHFDIYIPDDFDPASTLRINLRDFGADQSFDGGDDTVISTLLSASTTPGLVKGEWISVDFDITGLATRNNLGQIVFDAETNDGPRPSSFFVDNIYFFNGGNGGGGGGDPTPPTVAAPTPTFDAADVISVFSDVYTDITVEGFNFYGAAAFEVADIAGDGALRYTFSNDGGGNFQVIEFGGANQVDLDAAGMTNFRFDVWFPNPVAGDTNALFKLVDFGATTSEALITINSASNPAIAQGQWLTYDFSLADLAALGLGGRANIQQFVIDLVNSGELYLDNIIFHNGNGGGGGGPIAPTMGPDAPTQAEADVISIYSDSYTDNPRDGFNFYGAATFEEVDLGGNMALKYTFVDGGGGNFQVIELGGANQIDAMGAGMTNFRFDLWFPNEIAGDTNALFKLVDFGATTTEALIPVNSTSNPAIAQGQWLSFDFSMADLAGLGLGASSNIQQFVIDLVNSGEVYVDNIYFYNNAGGGGGGGPIAPTMGPDAPTQAEADVISIYSDSYTDNPRDGFNFYGAATFEEVDLGGNMALKYTFVDGGGGNFQVIELGGANQIDAMGAGMTNFRFDLWFPNEIAGDTNALFKLVDFGATTTEALIPVNSTSNPAIAQGQWLSFDFSMADLTGLGLGASSNIQQFVIDLVNSGEVYVDNIYFYNNAGGGGGGGPIAPTMGPDAPTQAEADVISIYSDSYTDNPRDGFNFYGAATFEEVDLGGNMALKYTFVDGGGGNFQVIELGGANQIDAMGAGMTNFRFDLWFPNEIAGDTNALFKLVDFGATTTEALIPVNSTSNPAIAQGQWLSFDFSMADLAGLGLGASSNIQQFVIDLVNSGEVYVDNIYFYNNAGGGGGGGPIAPTMGPDAPTQAEADVISIYSDSYTDNPRDGFNFYGAATFEEVDLGGNMALKYTFVDGGGGNFQVIELGGANQIDAMGAGMTNFRFDLWFPNEIAGDTNALFKLVDFGATTTEALIPVNSTSNPAIAQGQWLSFDFSMADLTGLGLGASSNIQQFVIDLVNSGEVYVDNIYFYNSAGGGGGGGGGGGTGMRQEVNYDFESGVAFTGVFEESDGVTGQIVANPDTNGNSSANVYEFNKANGAAWYSGMYGDLADIIDFSSTQTFTVKVWSPKAGASFRFQVVSNTDPGNSPSYELFQTVNTANTWVTLTFDFSGIIDPADNYDRIEIFPDFDATNMPPGDGSIYYIDDVVQQ